MMRDEDDNVDWPTEDLKDIMVNNPGLVLEYLELVRQLPLGEKAKRPTNKDRCIFHQHAADTPCPAPSIRQK